MRTDMIIAGVGGQGSIIAGTLLGTAAVVFDNKKALQTQAYSSELRGGAAVTWVIISDETIVYPRVVRPDILVAQASQALLRYGSLLKPHGTLVVDSDMVQEHPQDGRTLIRVPATSIASKEMKNPIVANLVIVGALIRACPIVSVEAMEKAIRVSVPKSKIEINLNAFRRGLDFSSS